jgi:hypothetical protein
MHPLISAYLDADLSREEQEELRAWLMADPAHLRDFVLCGCMHSQLRDLSYEKYVQATAKEIAATSRPAEGIGAPVVSDQAVTPLAPPTGSDVLSTTNQTKQNWAAWPVTHLTWVVSVLAVVGMAAGLYAWLGSRSPIVAQLTRTADCVWANSEHDANQGDLLKQGRDLDLLRGTAEITFTSGANVVIAGDSRFQLRGADVGMLYEGQLVAAIPKNAVGFSILTPRATLIDLGTEFSLRVEEDGSIELEVLQGLVELRPKDESGNEIRQLRIPYGRAVRMDASTGTVSTVPFHDPRPGSDAPSPEQARPGVDASK